MPHHTYAHKNYTLDITTRYIKMYNLLDPSVNSVNT